MPQYRTKEVCAISHQILVNMSDIPGDQGSQLPYQNFSPCCLAPVCMAGLLAVPTGARA
jgi:hypothetical protein